MTVRTSEPPKFTFCPLCMSFRSLGRGGAFHVRGAFTICLGTLVVVGPGETSCRWVVPGQLALLPADAQVRCLAVKSLDGADYMPTATLRLDLLEMIGGWRLL